MRAAVAALCKCAQVPMHGWLIKVMEAPTPVSALLHAGVINLGGFVWLRLFPVFDGLTLGHYLLIAVGGFTALVAVMTTTGLSVSWPSAPLMAYGAQHPAQTGAVRGAGT